MSLLFCDSFDHYSTAELARKYSNSANSIIDPTGGRRGGGCVRVGTSSSATLDLGFAQKSTFIFGAAIKVSAWSASLTQLLLAFKNSGNIRLQVRVTSGGNVIVERYNGGSPQNIVTAASVIALDTWAYLEFRIVISDTVGELEIRVNGTTVSSQTGIDTKDSISTTIDAVSLGNNSASGYTYFDDLYLCDSGGSYCNTFLGDVRIDAYLPAGNGNSSAFVGSDADSTNNYLLVDESSPDDDTTYVESNTPSAKDTYAFTEMTHNPAEIIATQLCAMGKKTDAGSRTIHLVTRSGGTDYDTASALAFGTSYGIKTKIDEVDPNTSAAWSKTNLNNAEFGIKVAS
jgi:hypothetical protein